MRVRPAGVRAARARASGSTRDRRRHARGQPPCLRRAAAIGPSHAEGRGAADRVEVTIMRTPFFLFSTAVAVVVFGGASISADRVRLRSGQTVDGSFMSADVRVVRLLLANGSIAEFAVDSVSAVEFS